MDHDIKRKIKLESRRSRYKTAIVLLVAVLFIVISFFSMSSIRDMHGNARVVNYIGIVRGATQRLVKKELMGQPDDALIARLDSIVNELITGEGPNGLVVLNDLAYMENMGQVQSGWALIKEEIVRLRAGGDGKALYNTSEDFFPGG